MILPWGAHAGQFIGFVARSGVGKTFSLLYNIYNAWKAGHKVMVVSTELPAIDMLKRLDALHLAANYNQFKKQLLATEEVERYSEFLFNTPSTDAQRLQVIDGGYGLNPSGLNVLIQNSKPEIVFIDGIYLLESDQKYSSGADWQKVRYLANEIKHRVAIANQIPVVYNTQFSRNVGTVVGGSKKVSGGLEDIGYGDEFGKASDLVISVYRTEEDIADKITSMKIIKGREVIEGLEWKINFDFKRIDLGELSEEHIQARRNFDFEQKEGTAQTNGNW